MAQCKNCIHEKVCLHRANIQTDTYAYMGVKYDTEKCEHFILSADVAPKSEVARELLSDLKKTVHDKAVYSYSKEMYPYINLKVFDAILQDYINKLEKR